MKFGNVMLVAAGMLLFMSPSVYAADAQLYTDKCASCHGEKGQGDAPIDGSDCSMATLEEIIDCYPTIIAHNAVTGCDADCIRQTNEYIFNGYTEDPAPSEASCQVDAVNLDDAKLVYEQRCASCHGNSVDEENVPYPLDGDACSLNTVQAMVDCYDDISLHGKVEECDEACVCATNAYIYEVLLEGGADSTNPDANSDSSSDDDSESSNIGCFVQALNHAF